MKKEEEVHVQEFKFNPEGTKAMGKEVFIQSWEDQKKLNKENNNGKPKGRIARFDPESAWYEITGEEKPREDKKPKSGSK